MNLLDQLAIFCKPSVSINLIDSPPRQDKTNTRQPRHHSVITETKTHDSRHTKSIQKIQTWAPANKSESKQRIVFKLIRTLSNKVRKHYYTFWVNYEQAAKNKINSKANNSQLGAQKVVGFVQAYQAKQSQHVGLALAFSKITKYAIAKAVQTSIQKAINPALNRSKRCFLQAFQQQQKSTLKIELLLNSIDMLFLSKLKFEVLEKIRKFVEINKLKSSIILGGSMKKSSILNLTGFAKKIKPPVENMKILSFFTKKEIQLVHQNLQNYEPNLISFSRQAIDKFIQNCPQICDNSFLFIQQPTIDTQENNLQYIDHQQQEINMNNLMKTKRSTSKPFLTIGSPMYESSISKGEVNLQQTMKKSYLTPRNRSISTASIFNIDQNRISKLEKKLFGEEIKNQSRFTVNGQDWMSDRKALDQIMNNMKSPVKYSRNSAYQTQLSNIRQKIEAYKDKQNSGVKQKNFRVKLAQSHCEFKNEKSVLLKKFLSQEENMKLKTENKILVSLKTRKKESMSSNRSQEYRKVSEKENQGRKLTVACRR